MVRVVRPRGTVCVEDVPVNTAPVSALTELVRSEMTGLPALSVRRQVYSGQMET